MKVLTRSFVAALALAFGFGGAVMAYEGATISAAHNYGGDCGCAAPVCGPSYDVCDVGCCDTGCDLGCDPCCGDVGWGLFTEAELLFFRYHRADGVRVGLNAGESGDFDFNPAYRVSLGTIAPNGIGFRTRYFEYDHTESIGDGQIGVDTYTIDFELFEAFELNQNWALEISGGVRYAHFNETIIDTGEVGGVDRRINGFNGAGLITGLEARRAVGFGLLYARTRLGVVQDDKHVTNTLGGAALTDNRLIDTTAGMVELALGAEVNYELGNGSVLFARSGVEWQNWWNFSSAYAANVNPAGGVLADVADSIYGGPADIGFAGLTFSLGLSY